MRLKGCLSLALLLFSAPFPALAELRPSVPSIEQTGRPVLQAGVPVPRGGVPLGAATIAFPDLSSCLADGRLRWERFRNLSEVEVCLFRVADAVSAPAAVADWMAATGFEVQPGLEDATQGFLHARPDETLTLQTFRWYREEQGDLFGPGAGSTRSGPFVIDVTIVWDAAGLPVDLTSTPQGRWAE